MAAIKPIQDFGKGVLEKLMEIKKRFCRREQFIKTQIIQTYCF